MDGDNRQFRGYEYFRPERSGTSVTPQAFDKLTDFQKAIILLLEQILKEIKAYDA
jgi:hypothetical protein